jgi:hypothetical protein
LLNINYHVVTMTTVRQYLLIYEFCNQYFTWPVHYNMLFLTLSCFNLYYCIVMFFLRTRNPLNLIIVTEHLLLSLTNRQELCFSYSK